MHTRRIIKTAICSRLIVIVIQIIGNHLIPDHNAGVFLSPKVDTNFSIFDALIQKALGGFLRWDAQYFIHIAKYGYTYENTLAFFPLYPMLISMYSRFLLFVFPFLNVDSSILFTAVLVNFVVFIFAAVSLYRLSIAILVKQDLSLKAALLFCFNPATIFFSAPYSETLFAFLTFVGIANVVHLYTKYLNSKKNFSLQDFLYLVPLAASTCTRSNGILNVGFLVCFFISFLYHKFVFKKSKQRDTFLLTLVTLTVLITSVALCLTPFTLYQIYAYNLFCKDFEITFPKHVISYAIENYSVLPGTFSQNNQTWCHQKIPFSYSYIQNRYWNVGFLRYFNVKQLPNFALAIPITFLIVKCSYQFFKNYRFNYDYIFFSNEKSNKFLPKRVFVFVVHALFLTIFNFLCIHVQVSTRILCSASPVLYWYCAFIFKDVPVNNLFTFRNYVRLNALQKFVKYYFIVYFIVGTILFCNFLPWT